MAAESSKPGRPAKYAPNWPALALVRMFLASVVVVSHVGIVAPDTALNNLRVFAPLAAVMGFFIVSGYSIAHSYTKRPDGFMRRRFWRIYPTFFVAMCLSTLPFLIEGRLLNVPNLAAVAPSHLDFLLNWVPLQSVIVAPIITNGPLWSLGLEVCFYLAAPLFIRAPKYLLVAVVLGSAVAYCNAPAIHFNTFEDDPSVLNLGIVAWAWLTGWLLYRYPEDRLLAIGGVVVPAVCMYVNNRYGGRLAPATAGGVALLIVCQRYVPEFKGAYKRVAVWLGDLSYPLYVCHFPTMILAFLIFGMTWWPALLACAFSVAAVVLVTVDHPLRRGGAAWVARMRARLAPAPAGAE